MYVTPRKTIFDVSTPSLMISLFVSNLMASIKGIMTPGLFGPKRICNRPRRYRSRRVNHPTATNSSTKVRR